MKRTVWAKAFSLILVLATLLSANVSALAQEYYTLPEIREQAQQGWHETYTDKYGRTREVDIDIEVYGGDTAPVLKAGWGDPTKVGFWYGEKQWGPIDEIWAAEKRKGVTTYLYEDVPGMKVDIDQKYAEAYGNDLTLREIYAFLQEELPKHGLYQDYLWERPSDFSILYSQHKNTGEVLVQPAYDMTFWPVEFGLPILTHVCWSFERGIYGPADNPELFVSMSGSNSYDIGAVDMDVDEILAEDIPLCSVEKVLQGAQGMIEDGLVKEVLSLRFGYVLYSDPEYEWNGRDTAYDIPTHYLVPSWVMQCYILDNPKVDKLSEFPMIREITINAQTGETMDYYDRSLRGRGDTRYKGFIPWEDVQ